MLADRIATLIRDKYNSLPPKGKPSTRSNGVKEWSVLAGIVAIHAPMSSDEEEKMHPICITTGIKATPYDHLTGSNGRILHDCHAEILALRCLNRFLILECGRANKGDTSEYVQYTKSGTNFKVKDRVRFALYISEAPCGDASLHLQFSDAEPWTQAQISTKHTTPSNVLRGRENFHIIGMARTKPGRRDSPMTRSMSCSDKLCAIQVKSLLNSLSSMLIDPLVYLDYLVIPEQRFDPNVYERCFKQRLEGCESAKSFEVLRTTVSAPSSCVKDDQAQGSHSSLIHLVDEGVTECIQKGIKEGFFMKKGIRKNGESAVSRRGLVSLMQREGFLDTECTYSDLKKDQTEYHTRKETARKTIGWWCGDDDFVIEKETQKRQKRQKLQNTKT